MEKIELKEYPGIKGIRKFHDKLKESFNQGNEITIDFESVERIDLSLSQVLIAAARSAKDSKKVLKIKNVSEGVKSQLKIAGALK